MSYAQPTDELEVDEVEAAFQRKDWDAAIDLLDARLQDAGGSLANRLHRAMAHSERARERLSGTPNASILDANDLKRIWRAAQNSVRRDDGSLEWGPDRDLTEGMLDHDVAKAILDYEYILARDSSLRQVLHEYTRLWDVHHVFDRAISVGEDQVRMHPHEPSGHEELIATYRHYIAWTRASRAIDWLDGRGTPYSRYFLGEAYRRQGELDQAERIFAALLRGDSIVPSQSLLLSRAKIHIAREQYREAHNFMERALSMQTLVGARLMLRDFQFVMNEREYAESQKLNSVSEFADFFDRLWARRNPAPGSAINWRLVEHYRRLVIAERDFEYFGRRNRPHDAVVGPDDVIPAYVADVELPAWYHAIHGFNDKGLIYIRHGDPDERVMTQPRPAFPPEPGVAPNESWRYAADDLIFHFVIPYGDGEAGSWPIVAALGDCHMAQDRRHWGGFYQQIAPRMQVRDPRRDARSFADPCGGDSDSRGLFDATAAMTKLVEEGQDDLTRGLTGDRHTWSTMDVEPFDFPFDVVAFRGRDGQTDVSVYFALPVGWFGEQIDSQELPVEIGLALHDTSWHPIARRTAVRRYPRSDDHTKAVFEQFDLTVPPDSYRVSIHADLIGAPELGGYQIRRRISDFTRLETMMSDVVLAYDIQPKLGHVPASRRSLQITPNPFHRAASDRPLHIYFELYNLMLSDDDRSRYTIRHTVQSTEDERGFLGLFGNEPAVLSAAASYEDATPSPIVYSQIDVSELPAGEYVLTIDVTDDESGEELRRTITLELLPSQPEHTD